MHQNLLCCFWSVCFLTHMEFYVCRALRFRHNYRWVNLLSLLFCIVWKDFLIDSYVGVWYFPMDVLEIIPFYYFIDVFQLFSGSYCLYLEVRFNQCFIIDSKSSVTFFWQLQNSLFPLVFSTYTMMGWGFHAAFVLWFVVLFEFMAW